MKKTFSSIFDQEEIELISFSLAKPTRFAPVPGLLSDGMGVLSVDGACKQVCAPVECTELGPECFGDEESCTCYDTEGDPLEATSGKTGGRCETGKYCYLIGGKACDECCQPGEGMSACKRSWRLAKGQSPSMFGDFDAGRCGTVQLADDYNEAYDESVSALTGGEYLDRKTDKSCGCKSCAEPPAGKTKEQFAAETSEQCCGRLINGEYVSSDKKIDVPDCVDSQGNKLEYVRKAKGGSILGTPCYSCFCPGTIKWKYECVVDGEVAKCDKVASFPFAGAFETKEECESALTSGSSDCGVHWKCDPETSSGEPCKPTSEEINEAHPTNPVFGTKQKCMDNCQFGYSCDIVGGEDKCVRKIPGDFTGENAQQECESALASGNCGIYYQCKLEGEARMCSPTKTDNPASTFFDSRFECENNCVVEFECYDNNNEVSCRRLVAYRPQGQTTPVISDQFATMEECENAVANGSCKNITFNCRLASDGGAECVPNEYYNAGVRKTYGQCMNDCEVRYRCKKFYSLPTSCEPFVAETEAEKTAPGVYETEQECCDNCCGCLESHGKCEYTRTYSGFGNSWDICSFGVTKQFCDNVEGKFTCCKSESDPGCSCPECPAGQPKAECTSSEYKRQKQGSTFGGGDECYCECLDQYEANLNGEDVCIVCGGNSELITGSSRGCKCNEGYETEAGLDIANPKTFGPSEGGTGEGRVPGTDGRKSVVHEDCVPKKYRCDITKDPPECVYVAVASRQEGESYFDSISDCQQNGCGRYNCSNEEECVAADANAGVSGSFSDKEDCEAACGKYECYSETVNGSTTSTCVKNPSGPYSGKKACEDAGCGKFKCEGGQCVPDLAGGFASFQECVDANCGKWYCTDKAGSTSPECKMNMAGNWPSGADVFASEEACNTAGCLRYKCDIQVANGADFGSCVASRNGEFESLEACENADPPCKCPAGQNLCTKVVPRKCVVSCTAPDFLLNDCTCGTCKEGEEQVLRDGKKYCCPKCPDVWVSGANGGFTKSNVRNPTGKNPCDCCTAFDCPDVGADPLRRPGCWVSVENDGSCGKTPMCRANASYVGGRCKCNDGYRECPNGGGCVKCNKNRKMDPQSCICYCDKTAKESGCKCGLKEDCTCKDEPNQGSCFEVIYDSPSPGLCYSRNRVCPPGQFLKKNGPGNCDCVCANGNLPALGTGLCDNTVPGPQGPVPPSGGGGGGGGGGGDGGGSSGSAGSSASSGVKCPANASAGSDGQCFCNYPQSFYSGENGGYCACAPGYVFGSDGTTCVDPWQPGGADGTGGSFMPEIPQAQENMCLGVDCPEGQTCVQTVFGAMCR